MRVKKHPILEFQEKEEIPFFFNGKRLIGFKGDTIASALVANGIIKFSHSIVNKRPRGFYCAIGNCGACNMRVNGEADVKTCITLLEANMIVENDLEEVVIND